MAAPNQPGPVTVVMGPGLRSNPNVHRVPCGSLRVRIEAGYEWVVASKTLRNARVRSADQMYFFFLAFSVRLSLPLVLPGRAPAKGLR
jgi:hypothetical protein